ncbi:MAG: IPTL-CTERM sorting domain-containing protein [Acidobacteriota bacterium]
MRYSNLTAVGVVVLAVCVWEPAFGTSRTVAVERQAGTIPGPACEDGLVLDDGTAETAYGWVPSAVWGEFVQTFPVGPLSSSRLDSVCICWTRTRPDATLDFEVVVYGGSQWLPGPTELFSFPAFVDAVPEWPDAAFVEVEAPVDAPVLGGGFYHIGVRWNPSADQFFFLCADQSPTDEPEGGFFRDDRAEGEWGSVLDTSDPIFGDHRAMMVRVRAHRVPWIPTMEPAGFVVLALLVGVSGWFALRRR